MKYEDLKTAEEAKRSEADQLHDSRTHRWEHQSGLVVEMTASDGGIAIRVDTPELHTGNLGSDPLQWLTADQLRFVADCRAKLEAWVDGGDVPAKAAR